MPWFAPLIPAGAAAAGAGAGAAGAGLGAAGLSAITPALASVAPVAGATAGAGLGPAGIAAITPSLASLGTGGAGAATGGSLAGVLGKVATGGSLANSFSRLLAPGGGGAKNIATMSGQLANQAPPPDIPSSSLTPAFQSMFGQPRESGQTPYLGEAEPERGFQDKLKAMLTNQHGMASIGNMLLNQPQQQQPFMPPPMPQQPGSAPGPLPSFYQPPTQTPIPRLRYPYG